MKTNNFRGWKKVFDFTFTQTTKAKGYRAVTIGFALLLFFGITALVFFTAKPDDKKVSESKIKQVLIINETSLSPIDFVPLLKQVKPGVYDHISISYTDLSVEDSLKSIKETEQENLLIVLSKDSDTFLLNAMLVKNAKTSSSEAEALLSDLTTCFSTGKMLQAGLSETELLSITAPVKVTVTKTGEDSSDGAMLVKMLAPLVFGMILYFMLLFNGQTICYEVGAEKTTKLMDTLLTLVHPYALISGKVLAVTLTAILQFLIWIVCGVTGLYFGSYLAQNKYPGYENTVITIVNFIRENVGASAFTLQAVILAVLVFCVGFLFYCVIAGLAGCMVSKPDDAANVQGVFTFPIVISFLVCYLAVITQNEGVLNVARFIPFTAPFCVPVDLLTGTMSISQGSISFALEFLFSLLVIMLSARIYKGLVLFNGEKITPKIMFRVIRNK